MQLTPATQQKDLRIAVRQVLVELGNTRSFGTGISIFAVLMALSVGCRTI